MRTTILAACGGFLVGVVWMDLMFDVQMLGASPTDAVASIAAYYRRVTTDAHPMNQLIGIVMAVAASGAVLGLRDRTAGRLRWLSLVSAVAPIGLAATRVFPDAVRLGMPDTPAAERIVLAQTICRDHLLCLALIATFMVTQLFLTRRGRPTA
jgi:hypothetical protein